MFKLMGLEIDADTGRLHSNGAFDGVNNKESNIPTKEFFVTAVLQGGEFWYYADLNPDKYYKNGNLKSEKLPQKEKPFPNQVVGMTYLLYKGRSTLKNNGGS